MSWFSRSSSRTTDRMNATRTRLGVERMEDRLTPIVGQFGAAVAPPVMFDGVVQLLHYDAAGNNFAVSSGTLLESGKHILTAAHVLTNGNGQVDSARTEVRFWLGQADNAYAGREVKYTVPASKYAVHPSWDGGGDNDYANDIAVLELPEIAPADAQRYDINRDTNEKGKWVELVGFGRHGGGSRGDTAPIDGQRRYGYNQIDDTTYDPLFGGRAGPNGTVLSYDFDQNGIDSLIAPGDSGGPMLIGGKVAGVHSTGWETAWFGGSPDSNFGEVGVGTRVSHFAGWIDGIVGRPQTVELDMRFGQLEGNDNRSDILVVRDSGSNVEIAVNNQVVSTLPKSAVTAVTVNGSTDDDVFVVTDLPFNVQLNANGGTLDTVVAPIRTNYWDITGIGRGDINNKVQFTGIETLLGQSGRDYFRFHNGGHVETINGGGGTDRLDYSDFSFHGVYVDLATGQASRVGNRVFSIEDITGTQLIDTLKGDDGTNSIYGLGGDDTIYGRGERDFLFGGSGTDYLYGEGGNDYLDGGRDFTHDYLSGGPGADTVVEHWNWVYIPGIAPFRLPEGDSTGATSLDTVVPMYW